MRLPGRRYRDEWLPNYYPSREIAPDRFLRLSRTGNTVVLSADDDRQISELFMQDQLFDRLERTGHIVTPSNAATVFADLRTWQTHNYLGPSLHIVVATTRCNLDCSYCHMNPQPVQAAKSETDLQPAVADRIIEFALASPNPDLTFEFQGGEPFLNFDAIQYVVQKVTTLKASLQKTIRFTIVSNLMVARDEQLQFCYDNQVGISYSVNGPAYVHDHYRYTRNKTGSHLVVMNRVQEIQEKFPGLISVAPLCVIDSGNAGRLCEIIDYFYDAGFSGVAIIRLKPLGNARKSNLTMPIGDFVNCYLQGLDHILAKNNTPGRTVFVERTLPVIMAKILGRTDVAFVDWKNPCGDVTGALTYDVDGEILPADEARSMRDKLSLGNVMQTGYNEFMQRTQSFFTTNLSLRDRDSVCRECTYNPFCGVSPVLDFARSGDPTPQPHQSEECLLTIGVLDWVFKRLLDHPLPLFKMIQGIGPVLSQLVTPREVAAPQA